MSESALRKRRGVTRASLTRLATRLRDLEGKSDQPSTLDFAQKLQKKLEELKSDFMTHHLALVEVRTKDEDLAAEQEILDIHDERATELEVEIQHLISACSSSLGSNTRKVITRKLTRLYRGVHDISDSLEGDADRYLQDSPMARATF